MAQQQKMMLYLFPIMYLFMGLVIPMGVLVYWVTNNLWTLVQQYLLIRNNPTPNTPAYLDWEERMIKKGKDPVQIAEDRRAKRAKKRGTEYTPRTVGGAQPSSPTKPSRMTDGKPTKGQTADTGNTPDEPQTGVARQQIQRQQPNRQSRAHRSTPKKKK